MTLQRTLKEAQRANRPLILDGALGTELSNRGISDKIIWAGSAPLEVPELLFDIHRKYADAGAEIVAACTFRATRRSFQKQQKPSDHWRNAVVQGVRLAKEAVGTKSLVAGSIGPLEDCYRTDLAPSFQTSYDEHLSLAELLAENQVDLIWLETFSSGQETRAAASAAAMVFQKYHIPFIVSMVTNEKGELLSGEPLVNIVPELEELGACAICANCIPPWWVNSALEALLDTCNMPVGIYPNLGRPEETQGWEGSAHLLPTEYAQLGKKWFTEGVQLIGGCCGSTPAHIEALAKQFR